ncbi:MAG: hypothetical protein J5758_06785 [Abditibacteriota bacterium]|nr:hypothetical protein [Abditibacteriota bacterium]
MTFLQHYSPLIIVWLGALATFAVYSILFSDNRFYRFFEHVFLGAAAGLGVYIVWSQVLKPMWWDKMVLEGLWYWVFALVLGSMFYFTYSQKHVWISRLIFGLFMGMAAGGLFREFAEIYMPQIVKSMKPVAGLNMTVWDTLNVLVFYLLLFTCMAYFFFSFDTKNKFLSRSAAWGRWFLMIGFGAIFGATVMGRMTLFIGRFNFLVNEWIPAVGETWQYTAGKIIILLGMGLLIILMIRGIREKRRKENTDE